jgi:hypothetical protein
MRLAFALVLALALSGAARAAPVEEVTLPAVQDLSLPFWCDWGYDWDERCYWDDGDRLGVGGVGDKVWRAGLRFSLDALPPEAVVVAAELSLWYDGTCVARRQTTRLCDGAAFELNAHPIHTPDWQDEREVEFGSLIANAAVDPHMSPGWVVWDLTDLVTEWGSGALANDGVLIKLADAHEDFDASGPAFPSSSYSDPAPRPRLTVWYMLE